MNCNCPNHVDISVVCQVKFNPITMTKERKRKFTMETVKNFTFRCIFFNKFSKRWIKP